MKFRLFLFALFLAFTGFSARLTINWQFTHVIEGYDHDNRLEIFLDGKWIATSDVYRQSALGTVSITVPSGAHTLKLMDYAFYEGEWEEHTVANQYSVDAFVEKEIDLKKDAVLNVVFDIESESVTAEFGAKKKSSDAKKAKNSGAADFTVMWNYENIVEGYDHESRMVVYIDGKRKYESPVARESEGGELTFSLPKGKHDLRFQTEVFYDGKWEEQLKANKYSIDAFFELSGYQSKNSVLKLTFDIEDESTSYNLSK